MISFEKYCFSGQGTPVDRLDQICKEWHQCRACSKLDRYGDRCNPNEVFYEVHYTPGKLYGSYSCSEDFQLSEFCCNNNSCARFNCQCDVMLAYEIAKQHRYNDWSSEFIINPDGSGFDERRCAPMVSNLNANIDAGNIAGSIDAAGKPGGVSASEWEMGCCGTYPKRSPYQYDRQTCCDQNSWYDGGFLVPYGAC